MDNLAVCAPGLGPPARQDAWHSSRGLSGDPMDYRTTVTLRSGAIVEVAFGYEPGCCGSRRDPDSVERPFCFIRQATVNGVETRDPAIMRAITREHRETMRAFVRNAHAAEWQSWFP